MNKKRVVSIVAVILAVLIIGWWAVKLGPADSGPRPFVTSTGGAR